MSAYLRLTPLRTSLSLLFLALLSIGGGIGHAAPAARSAATRTSSGGLSEGLLVEADLKQGQQVIAGRVLIEAGRTEWTTIAETKRGNDFAKHAAAGETPLKLEARATLLEPDIVEIETRITGRREQNGKMIVRLGERAEVTTAQMESSAVDGAEPAGVTAADSASSAADSTKVGVKVLRVRYTL